MKRTQTLELLVPKYVTRFSCIGGDCEDTCCSGWRVDLDKDSVIAYENCVDPVLRPRLKQFVKRNPKPDSDAQFGQMGEVENACRDCGMLTETKRCLIQERLGEAALSNVCTTYPRLVRCVNGLHQMGLTLSCPEAARLALLEPDAFEFDAVEHRVRSATIGGGLPAIEGLPDQVMDEVRFSLFQILQTRELDLSFRMKTVGLFCERLTRLLDERKFDAIPALLQTFDEALSKGELAHGLGALRERPDVVAQLSAILIQTRSRERFSDHQRKIFDLIVEGLGGEAIGSETSEDLVRRCEAGQARLVEALKRVPWLQDHFLLNEAFLDRFPWGAPTPIEHFGMLVVRAAVVRIMLVGRAGAGGEILTPDELAETVQVFARHYLHSQTFKDRLSGMLKESGWNTLEKLSLLL